MELNDLYQSGKSGDKNLSPYIENGDAESSPPPPPSPSTSAWSCSNTTTNNYNFNINFHYQPSTGSGSKSSLTEIQQTNDSLDNDQQNDNEHEHKNNDNDNDDDNNMKMIDEQQKQTSSTDLYIEHSDTTLNVTIDRYGFPMDDEMDEKEHRKQVKKENARLLKWQDMIFSKKSGGAASEESNETDSQIAHWNNVKNHRKLKQRIRKGVPQQLRGTVWQNLSGARERRKIECARYGSKNLYNDLKGRKKSKYHNQIWKDINRTYRKSLMFGASQLATASNNKQNSERNKNGLSAPKKQNGSQKFFKNKILDPQVVLTPQDLEHHATTAQLALYNVLKVFCLFVISANMR